MYVPIRDIEILCLKIVFPFSVFSKCYCNGLNVVCLPLIPVQ